VNRREFLFVGGAFFPALAIEAKANGATLKVRVNYTGTGTVDDDHRIFVVLWDSPDFMKTGDSSMRPFAIEPVTSKSGIATFRDVQKDPVYVSMAYDPTGKWDAKSPPPAGSSLGVFAKEPSVPSPITLRPGKSRAVSVTFDDSAKMHK
jgi:hypothetical protein